MPKERKDTAKYDSIVLEIFKSHYRRGLSELAFTRDELIEAAKKLGIRVPKNVGDILYSFRFRASLPTELTEYTPEDMEWTIELAGHGKYKFKLSKINRILPRSDVLQIKIPDSTPELVKKYSTSDEQALLTKVRYNRLIDIFLGITSYSLQNHLRTTVSHVGQIEIDEIYVGINKSGSQFVVPVQAKSGNDRLGVVQSIQDMKYCSDMFPELICRPVSAQFFGPNQIAMFELLTQDGEVKVVDEKHYLLVPSSDITNEELRHYQVLSK
ncbi:MAG: endonuclease [Deltaproteobacteria bacterium]|nr:endonuclease [Deltaproteobacteria bacterium]